MSVDCDEPNSCTPEECNVNRTRFLSASALQRSAMSSVTCVDDSRWSKLPFAALGAMRITQHTLRYAAPLEWKKVRSFSYRHIAPPERKTDSKSRAIANPNRNPLVMTHCHSSTLPIFHSSSPIFSLSCFPVFHPSLPIPLLCSQRLGGLHLSHAPRGIDARQKSRNERDHEREGELRRL